MSVLIKGMGIPKNCGECMFAVCRPSRRGFFSEVLCVITNDEIEDVYTRRNRLDSCPLIEVPPHGRLIDADAISEDDRQVYGFYNDYDLQQLLDNCPTTVEAEVEE